MIIAVLMVIILPPSVSFIGSIAASFSIPSQRSHIFTTLMQWIMVGAIAFIPALIWGWFFSKKRKEDRHILLLSFFGGILSVIPVIIYRELFYNQPTDVSVTIGPFQIPNLNIFSRISQLAAEPTLAHFVEFVIFAIASCLFIYICVAGLIALLDLILGKQATQQFVRTIKKTIEEPFIFLSVGVVIGICVFALDAISVGFGISTQVIYLVWTLVIVAALEEFSKHLILRFVNDGVFQNIDDVMEFALVVALGFAFLENIMYITHLWNLPCGIPGIDTPETCVTNPATSQPMRAVGNLWQIFIFRSLLSMFGHVIFSAIFGYFYGLAYFAKKHIMAVERSKFAGFMHRVLHIKGDIAFRQQKLMEGLLLSMLAHMVFNFMLSYEPLPLVSFTVPFLFVLYLFVAYWFEKKEDIFEFASFADDDVEKVKDALEVKKIHDSLKHVLNEKLTSSINSFGRWRSTIPKSANLLDEDIQKVERAMRVKKIDDSLKSVFKKKR